MFVAGLVNVVSISENANGNQTDNAIIKVSNNIVIHGSQRRCFFHKTKVVRLEKREICSCFEFSQHSRGTKLKWRPVRPRLQLRFPKLNAIWKKRCEACKKKNVRCSRKTKFHNKGKLQEFFRAGLNEIKYDYVDSKQHFYLQYHVAATDMKALCKKQTTLEAVVYLGFPAPGDKLSLGAPTQPVRGSIQ